jgi:hypothetical protein
MRLASAERLPHRPATVVEPARASGAPSGSRPKVADRAFEADRRRMVPVDWKSAVWTRQCGNLDQRFFGIEDRHPDDAASPTDRSCSGARRQGPA